MYDLLIKDGRIVTSQGSFGADIAINNGKIKIIKDEISEPADRIIDAKDKLVMPGMVDVHNHMEHGSGDDTTVDDFLSGSKAAAAGGVTTFMDFIIQKDGKSIQESFDIRNGSAAQKSVIDYSFHIALMDVDDGIINEIPHAIDNISSSFKLFMTYRKLGFMVNDDDLLSVMEKVNENNGIVGVHGENDSIVEYLRDKFVREGKLDPYYHAESRPNISEAEAINRIIQYSKVTGCPVYIFHLSTKESLELVRKAKSEGVNIVAETNPHYLLLNKEYYKRDDGQNFIMSPPLRTEEDNKSLWNAVINQDINILSTDHCPYHKEHKIGGKEDFRNVSPGIPGIELLLPLIYSEGVKKNKISLERMVYLLSYHPAKMFGLPSKGTLNVNTDADIVIFDPNHEWDIDPDKLFMNSDYSPYQEFKMKGRVLQTICRGNLVYDNNEILAEPGYGKYLYR